MNYLITVIIFKLFTTWKFYDFNFNTIKETLVYDTYLYVHKN